MVKVKAIRRLYRLNRMDFALAIVAVFGVLTFEALEGLLIAVILSLLALVWRASQSKLSVLGREPGRFILVIAAGIRKTAHPRVADPAAG